MENLIQSALAYMASIPWALAWPLIGVLACGFLFFKFNEYEDESVRNKWTGRWAWLNQRGSWQKKWKVVDNSTIQFIPTYFKIGRFRIPKQWWYFGVYPINVEKFTYSSTIFVFLTDPEHMFQFIKLRWIEIGLVFAGLLMVIPWWMAPLAWWIGVRLFAYTKEKLLPNIN